jgi:hypothetical protein
MRRGAAGPAHMTAGRARGDPGVVDQPGGGAVVRVGGVAVPGGERGQDPGPRGGGDRVAVLQRLQAFSLGVGGQRGGVQGGQVPQPGQDHVRRLGGGRGSGDAHLVLTSPGSSQAGPSGPDVSLDLLFDFNTSY